MSHGKSRQDRCQIPAEDPVFMRYHDFEWGVPVSSDVAFFEKVCLEGFQSGLSWRIILHRRLAFRRAFAGFDLSTVAAFTDHDVRRLMKDTGIIRNHSKIRSAINNAARALELRAECGSLAVFFWQFQPLAADRPARVTRTWLAEHPQTPESEALAKALKSRGWSYVGAVNMYALMQALGIVNDHVHGCSRRKVINNLRAQHARIFNGKRRATESLL
jgi:DNA-3-methyladenine glycosylase I